MKCDTFRRAVEAFDLDATVATFSPSIVLRLRDEPLEGRQAVGRLFAILLRVFEDSGLSAHIPLTTARKCCISYGAWATWKPKAST